MALFTIDRTINFDETKVKKVIQIINECTNEDRIDIYEVENKMIEKGIVSLRQDTNTHGFFSRRWMTFLKEYGLYDGHNLTEKAQLYGNNELSTKEFVMLFLIDRVVENQGKLIRPLEMLLRVSIELRNKLADNIIYENDLKYAISKLESNRVSINDVIEKIVSNRNENKKYDISEAIPPCHYDIWKNLLKSADLNKKNSNEICIDLNLPIIRIIMNYFC